MIKKYYRYIKTQVLNYDMIKNVPDNIKVDLREIKDISFVFLIRYVNRITIILAEWKSPNEVKAK